MYCGVLAPGEKKPKYCECTGTRGHTLVLYCGHMAILGVDFPGAFTSLQAAPAQRCVSMTRLPWTRHAESDVTHVRGRRGIGLGANGLVNFTV